jgi:hypothetical protein
LVVAASAASSSRQYQVALIRSSFPLFWFPLYRPHDPRQSHNIDDRRTRTSRQPGALTCRACGENIIHQDDMRTCDPTGH